MEGGKGKSHADIENCAMQKMTLTEFWVFVVIVVGFTGKGEVRDTVRRVKTVLTESLHQQV